MISRFMEKKLVIMFLGFITSFVLFGTFALALGLGAPDSLSNSLALSCVVIPVALLVIAIYQFKTSETKNRKLLTFAISALVSVVLVPILFLIGLMVLVMVTGVMPTPS